jgi:rRNA processing protein Krr1/Pno1
MFFNRRMQYCGALELAGQLVDFVVVDDQRDRRVMRIDVRLVGSPFDMRDMIEIRYSCSSTVLPSGKTVTLVGTP